MSTQVSAVALVSVQPTSEQEATSAVRAVQSVEPSLWVPPQEAATALVSVQPLGQEVDGVLAATQRGRVKTQTSEKRRLQAGVLTVARAVTRAAVGHGIDAGLRHGMVVVVVPAHEPTHRPSVDLLRRD